MFYHCNMKLNVLSTHIIVLLSAIFLAVLFDIKSLSWFWDMKFDGQEELVSKGLNVKATLKMKFVFWRFGLFIVSFYSLVVANLFLKNRGALLIILSNIFSYVVIAILGSWIFDLSYETNSSLDLTHLMDMRNILILVLSISFAYLLIYIEKNRLADLENARLKEEKSRAELTALKEQLSPHFFFNTLNSLSALIRNEQHQESLEFIENLADVFRYTLDSGSKDLVTVQEELKLLEVYHHLISTRFGQALRLKIELPDKVHSRLIPPMALQLLLENVIKHNQLTEKEAIQITIKTEDDFLLFRNSVKPKVVNDSNGLGLANLNRRYQMLSGKELRIQKDVTEFIVKLPLIEL